MNINLFKNNAWGIVIALLAVVSSYAVYGYRISALEQRAAADEVQIKAQSDQNLQVQVTLVKIQTDIEYIKIAIDNLSKK